MLQLGGQEHIETLTGEYRWSAASKWGTPRRYHRFEIARKEATTELIEDLVNFPVDDKEPSKVLKLGKNLSDELWEMILAFLKQNLDAFTWMHSDMEGIDPEITCHHLNLDSEKKLVRQKRRAIDAERYQALKDKLDKLLTYDFIKESFYPS